MFLDRLVIVGNHRDAWTYGAADPSSGTAVMLEVARALGWLMKEKGGKQKIINIVNTIIHPVLSKS